MKETNIVKGGLTAQTSLERDVENSKQRIKKENLKLLEDFMKHFSEDKELVFFDPDGNDGPFRSTIANLRTELMEGKHPWERLISPDEEPDAYFKDLEQQMLNHKTEGLLAVSDLSDTDIIWYDERNYAGSYLKTTVADWREHYKYYNWSRYNYDNQTGGRHIVSTDPNFEPDLYRHRLSAEREGVSIETNPEELERAQALRQSLLDRLALFAAHCPEDRLMDVQFEIQFSDGSPMMHGNYSTVWNLIAGATVAEMVQRGIPKVTISSKTDKLLRRSIMATQGENRL